MAVDPELGRIAFSQGDVTAKILVSYYYGFIHDQGGGEYPKSIYQPRDFELYSVGQGGLSGVTQALYKWQDDKKSAKDEAQKKRPSPRSNRDRRERRIYSTRG